MRILEFMTVPQEQSMPMHTAMYAAGPQSHTPATKNAINKRESLLLFSNDNNNRQQGFTIRIYLDVLMTQNNLYGLIFFLRIKNNIFDLT